MPSKINNDFYDQLDEEWYSADDHAIALLRAEQKLKNPWVRNEIKSHFSHPEVQILDLGCGAGFLTNHLIKDFNDVTGIDISKNSLKVAQKHDASQRVKYIQADVTQIPFSSSSFDVVCMMDLIEHIEDQALLVKEACRVLKPGGILFFHTFNRNFLAWFIIIKLVEWLTPRAPKNLHVIDLFIKPSELEKHLNNCDMQVQQWHGVKPILNKSFLKSIFTRRVCEGFEFEFTPNLLLGYVGVAKKC